MGREWGQGVGSHPQTPAGCPENAPRTKGERGVRARKQTEVVGKMQQGRPNRMAGDAETLWEASRKAWAHSAWWAESRRLRGQRSPRCLATSPSLCGLSWALEMPPRPSSLVSAGFEVQNFLPHLVSAIGPQESESTLNQNGRLDY